MIAQNPYWLKENCSASIWREIIIWGLLLSLVLFNEMKDGVST